MNGILEELGCRAGLDIGVMECNGWEWEWGKPDREHVT